MSQPKATALVLGHGTRAFLSVIRSLGRAGINVHVGMCPESDLALKSRYVRAFHDIPEFDPGGARWLSVVENILEKTPIELVIPCNDHAVIPLQIYNHRLSRISRIYTLNERAFRIAFDKIESFNLAKELGIPQPRSKVDLCTTPADQILDGLLLPVVLKPPSSFVPEDLLTKRSVVRCRSHDEVAKRLRESIAWGNVLVQENFNGRGVGVELLACEGETLVAFQHERVHEPLEGGGSSYRRSTKLHPDLLASSKALMKALNYTGVAMVEFKVNAETGEWVFIEINGRFWGSLPLAIAAGADFPRYLYEMLVNGKTDFPKRYRSGVYCRNVSADLYWLRANLASNRKDPTLATRPLGAVALEVLNVLALREHWDTMTLDDPRVGLAECKGLLKGIARNGARSLLRRTAATAVGRRLAAHRTFARARAAGTVLFVCKGNICRSPFAEHYARSVFPSHVNVVSGGYLPMANRESPAAALVAAREFAVELSQHRSTILDVDTVKRADVIFVFDEHNLDTVRKVYPLASKRVFRLGAMLRGDPLAIRDPYGGDTTAFKAVYRQIARAIDCLAAGLDNRQRPQSSQRSFGGREKASTQT